MTMRMNRELGLLDVLGALERAESDKHIDGIYLNLSPVMPLGMATMEEPRDALVKFKERSGAEFVVAYSRFLYPGYLLPQFSGRPNASLQELCCGRGFRRT
ncbi:MAG: hypothetical protein ACLTZY_02070 [Alistipes indistinctus]